MPVGTLSSRSAASTKTKKPKHSKKKNAASLTQPTPTHEYNSTSKLPTLTATVVSPKTYTAKSWTARRDWRRSRRREAQRNAALRKLSVRSATEAKPLCVSLNACRSLPSFQLTHDGWQSDRQKFDDEISQLAEAVKGKMYLSKTSHFQESATEVAEQAELITVPSSPTLKLAIKGKEPVNTRRVTASPNLPPVSLFHSKQVNLNNSVGQQLQNERQQHPNTFRVEVQQEDKCNDSSSSSLSMSSTSAFPSPLPLSASKLPHRVYSGIKREPQKLHGAAQNSILDFVRTVRDLIRVDDNVTEHKVNSIQLKSEMEDDSDLRRTIVNAHDQLGSTSVATVENGKQKYEGRQSQQSCPNVGLNTKTHVADLLETYTLALQKKFRANKANRTVALMRKFGHGTLKSNGSYKFANNVRAHTQNTSPGVESMPSYVLGNDLIPPVASWAGRALSQSCQSLGSVIAPLEQVGRRIEFVLDRLVNQLNPSRYHHPEHPQPNPFLQVDPFALSPAEKEIFLTSGHHLITTHQSLQRPSSSDDATSKAHNNDEDQDTTQEHRTTYSNMNLEYGLLNKTDVLARTLREAHRVKWALNRRIHVEQLRAKILKQQIAKHRRTTLSPNPHGRENKGSENAHEDHSSFHHLSAKMPSTSLVAQSYTASSTTGYWPAENDLERVSHLSPSKLIQNARLHPIQVNHPDTPGLFRAVRLGDNVGVVRLVVLQETRINTALLFSAVGDDELEDEHEGTGLGLFSFEAFDTTSYKNGGHSVENSEEYLQSKDDLVAEQSSLYEADNSRIVVTPLMAAVISGHFHVVQTLLLLGADPSIKFPAPPFVAGGYISAILLAPYADEKRTTNNALTKQTETTVYFGTGSANDKSMSILLLLRYMTNQGDHGSNDDEDAGSRKSEAINSKPMRKSDCDSAIDTIRRAGTIVSHLTQNVINLRVLHTSFSSSLIMPAHVVAYFGEIQSARFMFRDYSLAPKLAEVRTASQLTPLFIASARGHAKVVELLLTIPSIVVDAVSKLGVTPLFVASQGGHIVVVNQLLHAGAIIDRPCLLGMVPLSISICAGDPPVYQSQNESVKIRQKGIGINVLVDDESQASSSQVASLFLAYGDPASSKTADLYTPPMIATLLGDFETLEKMRRVGVLRNEDRNNEGESVEDMLRDIHHYNLVQLPTLVKALRCIRQRLSLRVMEQAAGDLFYHFAKTVTITARKQPHILAPYNQAKKKFENHSLLSHDSAFPASFVLPFRSSPILQAEVLRQNSKLFQKKKSRNLALTLNQFYRALSGKLVTAELSDHLSKQQYSENHLQSTTKEGSFKKFDHGVDKETMNININVSKEAFTVALLAKVCNVTLSSVLRHRYALFISLQFHALDNFGNSWISVSQFSRIFVRCVLLLTARALQLDTLTSVLNDSKIPRQKQSPQTQLDSSQSIALTLKNKNLLIKHLHDLKETQQQQFWYSKYLHLSLSLGLTSRRSLEAALARFQQVEGDSTPELDSINHSTNSHDKKSLSMRNLIKFGHRIKKIAMSVRDKILNIVRDIRRRLMSDEARAFEDHRAWPPVRRLASASKMPLSALIRYAHHHSELVAQFLLNRYGQADRTKSKYEKDQWLSMMVLDAPNVPQLYACAMKDDVVGIVRCAVLFGTDVDSIINDKTVLMVAAANGSVNACRALLRLRANVNYVDRDGVTAMTIACANGHENVALLLLEKRQALDKFDDESNTELFPRQEFANPHEHKQDAKSAEIGSCDDIKETLNIIEILPSDSREVVRLKRQLNAKRKRNYQLHQNSYIFTAKESNQGSASMNDNWFVMYGTHDVDIENGRGLTKVDPRIPLIRRGRGYTALHLACTNGLTRATNALIEEAHRMVVVCCARAQTCQKSVEQSEALIASYAQQLDVIRQELKVVSQPVEMADEAFKHLNEDDQRRLRKRRRHARRLVFLQAHSQLTGHYRPNSQEKKLTLREASAIEIDDDDSDSSTDSENDAEEQARIERYYANKRGVVIAGEWEKGERTKTMMKELDRKLAEKFQTEKVTGLNQRINNIIKRSQEETKQLESWQEALALRTSRLRVAIYERHAMFNAKSAGALSPLFLAAHAGHLSTVKLLLEHTMVNTGLEEVRIMSPKNILNATPQEGLQGIQVEAKPRLEQATNPQQHENDNSDVNEENKENRLILTPRSTIVDVNSSTRRGAVPLFAAAQRGHLQVVECLLLHGADIFALTKDGMSALHIATIQGHKEVVDVLLKYGAKQGTKDSHGNTELHSAALLCQFQILQILLYHGGSPACRNNAGNTVDEVLYELHGLSLNEVMANIDLFSHNIDNTNMKGGQDQIEALRTFVTYATVVTDIGHTCGLDEGKNVGAQKHFGSKIDSQDMVPNSAADDTNHTTNARSFGSGIERTSHSLSLSNFFIGTGKHHVTLKKIKKDGTVNFIQFCQIIDDLSDNYAAFLQSECPGIANLMPKYIKINASAMAHVKAILFHLVDDANDGRLGLGQFMEAFERWSRSLSVRNNFLKRKWLLRSFASNDTHATNPVKMKASYRAKGEAKNENVNKEQTDAQLQQPVQKNQRKLFGLSLRGAHVITRSLSPHGDLFCPMALHLRIPQQSVTLDRLCHRFKSAQKAHNFGLVKYLTEQQQKYDKVILSSFTDLTIDLCADRQTKVANAQQLEDVRLRMRTRQQREIDEATIGSPEDHRLLIHQITTILPDTNKPTLMQALHQIQILVLERGCNIDVQCSHNGPLYAWRTWADAPDGWTPLLLACRNGNLALVKHLVWLKADVEFQTSKLTEGETPLLAAVRHGHDAVVAFLLQVVTKSDSEESAPASKSLSRSKAIMNITNDCHESPLYVAVLMQHVKILKILFDAGDKIFANTSSQKITTAHDTPTIELHKKGVKEIAFGLLEAHDDNMSGTNFEVNDYNTEDKTNITKTESISDIDSITRASVSTTTHATGTAAIEETIYSSQGNTVEEVLVHSSFGHFQETLLVTATALGNTDCLRIICEHSQKELPPDQCSNHFVMGKFFGAAVNPLQTLLLLCNFKAAAELLPLYPVNTPAREAAETLCQDVFDMSVSAAVSVSKYPSGICSTQNELQLKYPAKLWFGLNQVPFPHQLQQHTSTHEFVSLSPESYFMHICSHTLMVKEKMRVIIAMETLWHAQQALLHVPVDIQRTATMKIEELMSKQDLAEHTKLLQRGLLSAFDESIILTKLRAERAALLRDGVTRWVVAARKSLEISLAAWFAVFDLVELQQHRKDETTTLIQSHVMQRLGSHWKPLFLHALSHYLILHLRSQVCKSGQHNQASRRTAGAFCCASVQSLKLRNIEQVIQKQRIREIKVKEHSSESFETEASAVNVDKTMMSHKYNTSAQRIASEANMHAKEVERIGLSVPSSSPLDPDAKDAASLVFEEWIQEQFCARTGIAATFQLFGRTLETELAGCTVHQEEVMIRRSMRAAALVLSAQKRQANSLDHEMGVDLNLLTNENNERAVVPVYEITRLVRAGACGDNITVLRQLVRTRVSMWATVTRLSDIDEPLLKMNTVTMRSTSGSQQTKVWSMEKESNNINTDPSSTTFFNNEMMEITCLRASILNGHARTVRLILNILRHAEKTNSMRNLDINKCSKIAKVEDDNRAAPRTTMSPSKLNFSDDSNKVTDFVAVKQGTQDYFRYQVESFELYVKQTPNAREIEPDSFFHANPTPNCWLLPKSHIQNRPKCSIDNHNNETSTIKNARSKVHSEPGQLPKLHKKYAYTPGALTLRTLQELSTALFVATFRREAKCLKVILSEVDRTFGPHITRFLLTTYLQSSRWTCLHFAAQDCDANSENGSDCLAVILQNLLPDPYANFSNKAWNRLTSWTHTYYEQQSTKADLAMQSSEPVTLNDNVFVVERWATGSDSTSSSLLAVLQATEMSVSATPLFIAVSVGCVANVRMLLLSLNFANKMAKVLAQEPATPCTLVEIISSSSPNIDTANAKTSSRSFVEFKNSVFVDDEGSSNVPLVVREMLDIPCVGTRCISALSNAFLRRSWPCIQALISTAPSKSIIDAERGPTNMSVACNQMVDSIAIDGRHLSSGAGIEGLTLLMLAIITSQNEAVYLLLKRAYEQHKHISKVIKNICNESKNGEAQNQNLTERLDWLQRCHDVWQVCSEPSEARCGLFWLEPSMLLAAITGELTVLCQLLTFHQMLRQRHHYDDQQFKSAIIDIFKNEGNFKTYFKDTNKIDTASIRTADSDTTSIALSKLSAAAAEVQQSEIKTAKSAQTQYDFGSNAEFYARPLRNILFPVKHQASILKSNIEEIVSDDVSDESLPDMMSIAQIFKLMFGLKIDTMINMRNATPQYMQENNPEFFDPEKLMNTNDSELSQRAKRVFNTFTQSPISEQIINEPNGQIDTNTSSLKMTFSQFKRVLQHNVQLHKLFSAFASNFKNKQRTGDDECTFNESMFDSFCSAFYIKALNGQAKLHLSNFTRVYPRLLFLRALYLKGHGLE